MELNQHTLDDNNLIKKISESEVFINDNTFQKSVILSNQTITTDLGLESIDELTEQHVEQLLQSKPDIIIFGSGVNHLFPKIELLQPIAKQNIGFEVMNNKSAARTYNVLVTEMRKVACLLIL